MTDASQYLLVCYLEARADGEPVAPGDVAERLDRSPAATTEMLQRLEQRGYLAYEPYEGATLTAAGRREAESLYDSYVVLAEFFRTVLELEDPDREAIELAGHVSSLVTDRVAETLLESDTEPDDHGGPSLERS
ncbi:metal-dependent transcriptional regulator [Halopiger goleimassiliensis]|uniref:metal-dependent transcriptional regulator n=1 Tax=Halopiger goleimassiliensis TaxID=1293048 RepID=UPI0006777DE5|nr:metal-dependent transcriptional regulator [Halopiger goleimassiliensis]